MDSRQPSLQTARLQLQPAAREDLNRLHALWSKPDVRRFLFDDQEVSRELAASVLDSCLARATSGCGLWLVSSVGGAELVGCVGLLPASTAADREPALAGLLEVLASFAPAHWHRGYAHEALSAVLAHAFGALDQAMIAAVNDVPNVASERMLNRLGFEVLSEVQGPRFRMRTYILRRSSGVPRG